MKGFVQTNGKFYDLDTGDELTLNTFEHDMYGDIKYVEVETVVDCDKCGGTGQTGDTCTTCNGKGMIDEETECSTCNGARRLNLEACNDCSGEGTITENEIPITIENPPDEADFKIPNGWKVGGQ